MEEHLSSKLEIPKATVPVVRRPRLFTALDHATEHRVTVLDAPAGAGKTMLLASWLRESGRETRTRTGAHAAWVSLDRGDNRPGVFFSAVLAALRRGYPDGTGDPLARLTVSDPFDDSFPPRLVQALARLRGPALLVLDDVQECVDQPPLAGLEFLLRHAPPTLRLVLSGRGQPRVPLARLRVAGELVDLRSGDLAGTAAEAAELFDLLGVELSPAEIDVVVARTEGWMSGFRLAALWYEAQPEGRRDIRGFAGDERMVADYLNDEILAGQAPAVREFLLRTCLVDTLTGPLADQLTDRHDGAQLLDHLERENALVESVGPHRIWFRYRPLLREFLRAELARRLGAEIPALRGRAARWYDREHLTLSAVGQAVAAEDWAFATRLLVALDRRVVDDDRRRELEPLLAQIPEERVIGYRPLAAVLAAARLAHGDPAGAEPYLRIAEPLPERDPGRDLGGDIDRDIDGDIGGEPEMAGPPAEDLAHRLRFTDLRLHQDCLRGWVEQGRLDATAKLLNRATQAAVLPGLHPLIGSLAFRFGLAQVWCGHTVAARAAMSRALPYLEAPDQAVRWRRALAWYALLSATEGRLAATDAALAELAAASPEPSISALRPAPDPSPVPFPGSGPDPGVGLRRLAEALVSLQRDRLETAWTLLDSPGIDSPGIDSPGIDSPGIDAQGIDAQGIDAREPGGPATADGRTGLGGNPIGGEPPMGPCFALIRGQVLIARASFAAARTELAAGRERDAAWAAEEPRRSPLRHRTELAEAEALLAEGELRRARAVLTEAIASCPARDFAMDSVALGRLCLAEGDPVAALDAVTPCLLGSTTDTRRVDTLGARLVAAAAHRRLGEAATGAEHLEAALALNEADRAVRVFLTAGRTIHSLLAVAARPGDVHAEQRTLLLHHFETQRTPQPTSPHPVPLTGSETAVLRYLPLYLTNEEIAADLYLSVNTVKSHLRTLYRKLGVASRREAVGRARQLGLLPP